MQPANECPCWGLERPVCCVKFSHWVFPSFEVLELTTVSQKEWPCECGGGGRSVAAGCRWLFVAVVRVVQLLCLHPLFKPTELLLPRLFWHCFSPLLVLPDYLLYAAACLPTCCESSVLQFCQHKEPAAVNLCLPLHAWARSSLNPRTM